MPGVDLFVLSKKETAHTPDIFKPVATSGETDLIVNSEFYFQSYLRRVVLILGETF